MKRYCLNLSMIPYPSGKLHIGHVRNYLINDILNKYIKINNYNILMPMGWDSFGTPAENKSILKNILPYLWIKKNIELMKNQFERINFSINWNKEFLSSNYKYYKWNQWLFLKFLKNNFIYLDKSKINWDPKEKTILSNEQVINGKGWRSNCNVKKKNILSYYLKILKYKKELLYELKNLNWPKSVKIMQNNWIGLSYKFNFNFFFKIKKIKNIFIRIEKKTFLINLKYFYININFLKKKYKINKYFYKNFKIKFKKKLNKKNFFNLGINLINYFILKKIEVFNNGYLYNNYFNKNFDKKDNFYYIPNKDFKKNNILIIKKEKKFLYKKNIINFHYFLYLKNNDYKNSIKFFKIKKYKIWKLKNWSISRQRYWGTPIPIINCKLCKKISLLESNLPVILPKKLKPIKNNLCLKNNLKFYKTYCLNCKMESIREIDTMDTFFDSSWYFLNYFLKNENFFKNDFSKWLPINLYIGGIEHAILHLLYSRFFIKFLRDIKILFFGEPFLSLYTQGMVLNKTYYIIQNSNKVWLNKNQYFKHLNKKELVYKGNIEKMSKSKNNGIKPDSLILKYGSDSLKFSIISFCPIWKNLIWKNRNIKGVYKFLCNIYIYFKNIKIKKKLYKFNNINFNDKILLKFLYTNFIKINNCYKNINFNYILKFSLKIFNIFKKYKFNIYFIFDEFFSILLRILYPIIPNLTSLIWNKIYFKKLNYIKKTFWPRIFKIKLKKNIKITILLNNKFLLIFNFYLLNFYYIKKKINNIIFFKNNYYKINNIKEIFFVKKLISIKV